MKQEIVCIPCGKKLRELLLPPEDGEHVKFVKGAALTSFICDNCSREIPAGAQAEALSIYTDNIPYSKWEHCYIKSDGVGE